MVAVLLALAGWGMAPTASGQDKAKERVVLQVSDDNEKNWTTAFNVVNNLTNAYGKGNVEIEIVAFSDGIQSLMFDSKVQGRFAGARERGAKILACENSMGRFKLKRSDMASEVDYVPTGVVHMIKRQKEGWTIIRP
jgi:intracellular sulfur oxidation DsrE/DsrF family protein